MKIRTINQTKKSDSLIENLVDKSLGRAKVKLTYSDRRHSTRGKRERENSRPDFCRDDFLSDMPELIRPELVASVLGVSVKTIYDWRYRSHKRRIPPDLFVKVNRSLLIRTSILREWIASQNPSLQSGRK